MSANGAGCYSSPKTDPCNDNNACTTEYCSGDQCIRSDVVCADKPCYEKLCDTTKGCVYTAKGRKIHGNFVDVKCARMLILVLMNFVIRLLDNVTIVKLELVLLVLPTI